MASLCPPHPSNLLFFTAEARGAATQKLSGVIMWLSAELLDTLTPRTVSPLITAEGETERERWVPGFKRNRSAAPFTHGSRPSFLSTCIAPISRSYSSRRSSSCILRWVNHFIPCTCMSNSGSPPEQEACKIIFFTLSVKATRDALESIPLAFLCQIPDLFKPFYTF